MAKKPLNAQYFSFIILKNCLVYLVKLVKLLQGFENSEGVISLEFLNLPSLF